MVLHVIRKSIINIINYDKAKTMFFGTNARDAHRGPSTIADVKIKCRDSTV